ncbi:hypothetical protein ACS0TY_033706 [Phlomoides rotata]
MALYSIQKLETKLIQKNLAASRLPPPPSLLLPRTASARTQFPDAAQPSLRPTQSCRRPAPPRCRREPSPPRRERRAQPSPPRRERRRAQRPAPRSFTRVALRQSQNSHGNIAYLPKCSLRQIHMESSKQSDSRGALIVLEGLDHCGKTSQCSRLLSYLEELGHAVESWRFPDRNTGVGQMISSYLANDSHLDDHAIHLLFSANRWEKRSLMESKLRSGTTLIVDRYSFSGVAFSSAKGLDVEWCKAPDAGLLAPDLVVYLDISPEKAAERGGYGGERYEKLEFQKRVSQSYKMLCDDTWKIVDATLPMEDIEKKLQQIVMECILKCLKGKPFSELWLN